MLAKIAAAAAAHAVPHDTTDAQIKRLESERQAAVDLSESLTATLESQSLQFESRLLEARRHLNQSEARFRDYTAAIKAADPALVATIFDKLKSGDVAPDDKIVDDDATKEANLESGRQAIEELFASEKVIWEGERRDAQARQASLEMRLAESDRRIQESKKIADRFTSELVQWESERGRLEAELAAVKAGQEEQVRTHARLMQQQAVELGEARERLDGALAEHDRLQEEILRRVQIEQENGVIRMQMQSDFQRQRQEWELGGRERQAELQKALRSCQAELEASLRSIQEEQMQGRRIQEQLNGALADNFALSKRVNCLEAEIQQQMDAEAQNERNALIESAPKPDEKQGVWERLGKALRPCLPNGGRRREARAMSDLWDDHSDRLDPDRV